MFRKRWLCATKYHPIQQSPTCSPLDFAGETNPELDSLTVSKKTCNKQLIIMAWEGSWDHHLYSEHRCSRHATKRLEIRRRTRQVAEHGGKRNDTRPHVNRYYRQALDWSTKADVVRPPDYNVALAGWPWPSWPRKGPDRTRVSVSLADDAQHVPFAPPASIAPLPSTQNHPARLTPCLPARKQSRARLSYPPAFGGTSAATLLA
jgi:hypothetical protein